MHTTESPAWDHGVPLAIYFFGWMGLTLYFDGIANSEQAIRVLWEAVLFTSMMAAVDLGISVYRPYRPLPSVAPKQKINTYERRITE